MMCLFVFVAGRDVSGLSRHLETLGTATGKIASCYHSPLRFVRRRGGGHAFVWHAHRLVQLGDAVLRVRWVLFDYSQIPLITNLRRLFCFRFLFRRRDGTYLVRVLVLAVFRETQSTSHHIGQRAELHRNVIRGRQADGRSDYPQHSLERILHLHARVRHYCRKLLSVVELLSTRAVSSFVPSFVQLRSVCS